MKSRTRDGVSLILQVRAKRLPRPPPSQERRQATRQSPELVGTGASGQITRTDRLLSQQAARNEAATGVEAQHKLLVDKYQCYDSNCPNEKGFCYTDWGHNHFAVETVQLDRWARCLHAGNTDCTLEQPPRDLFNYWTRIQGPVTTKSKYSLREHLKQEKQGMGNRLETLMESSLKINEMKMMRDLTKIAAPESTQEHHYPQSMPQVPQVFVLAQAAPISLPQVASAPVAPSVSAPVAPALSSRRPRPPTAPNEWSLTGVPLDLLEVVDNSSPINSNEEDDSLVLSDFFDWKMTQYRQEEAREAVSRAYTIVQTQFWKARHLKLMVDTRTHEYKLARELGLPDGLVRSFYSDLQRFKQVWRTTRGLLALGNCHAYEAEGGGFIRPI